MTPLKVNIGFFNKAGRLYQHTLFYIVGGLDYTKKKAT